VIILKLLNLLVYQQEEKWLDLSIAGILQKNQKPLKRMMYQYIQSGFRNDKKAFLS
jgi:hypothetical protein